MKASEKFRKIFGKIDHLAEDVSWTMGLSNLAEFLLWNPQSILGVTKKQYVRQIIQWALAPEMQGKTLDEVEKVIDAKLKLQMALTEQSEPYAKKNTGICNAREALRRLKYFSEDYLNKEFDIFLSLASDAYLDKLYSRYVSFNNSGHWAVHGNSGLFEFSTELDVMAMDNLAYNAPAKLLIANELKLNGSKNNDQILKYAYMIAYLIEKGFVDEDAKLVLVFISGKTECYDKTALIKNEIEFCKKNIAKYHRLLKDNVIAIASETAIFNMTWQELLDFNEAYLLTENLPQVETKLIAGFNKTLKQKSFIHLT